jgi:hypothetical protein
MPPRRHPKKEIRDAVKYAEDAGWTTFFRHGHAWAVLYCGQGCHVSVWSTPRSSDNHARQIKKAIDKCPHRPTP